MERFIQFRDVVDISLFFHPQSQDRPRIVSFRSENDGRSFFRDLLPGDVGAESLERVGLSGVARAPVVPRRPPGSAPALEENVFEPTAWSESRVHVRII